MNKQDRIYWKNDIKFMKFNDEMLKNLFTFEEIITLIKFDRFEFKKKIDLSAMKNEWLELVRKWNKIRKVDNDYKSYGFVGAVYFFVIFPFDELINIDKYFTKFHLKIFNLVYFYCSEGENNSFIISKNKLLIIP